MTLLEPAISLPYSHLEISAFDVRRWNLLHRKFDGRDNFAIILFDRFGRSLNRLSSQSIFRKFDLLCGTPKALIEIITEPD